MQARFGLKLTRFAIVALSLFGIYECLHAIVIAVRGGTHDFGGAFDYPLWAVAHFAGSFLFISLMPIQLWERFRNGHRRLHRVMGRILFVAGVTAASGGIVLPFAMPSRPVSEKVFMTVFSLTFVFFLTQSVRWARNRNFVRHREWILRTVAVALGPLVQRLILPIFLIALGVRSMPEFWEYFMTSAWLSAGLTLTAAEWWIRASSSPRALQSDALNSES